MAITTPFNICLKISIKAIFQAIKGDLLTVIIIKRFCNLSTRIINNRQISAKKRNRSHIHAVNVLIIYISLSDAQNLMPLSATQLTSRQHCKNPHLRRVIL